MSFHSDFLYMYVLCIYKRIRNHEIFGITLNPIFYLISLRYEAPFWTRYIGQVVKG